MKSLKEFSGRFRRLAKHYFRFHFRLRVWSVFCTKVAVPFGRALVLPDHQYFDLVVGFGVLCTLFYLIVFETITFGGKHYL